MAKVRIRENNDEAPGNGFREKESHLPDNMRERIAGQKERRTKRRVVCKAVAECAMDASIRYGRKQIEVHIAQRD